MKQANNIKLQCLVNKVDEINCNKNSNMQDYKDACTELGKFIYEKSLESKSIQFTINNPRKMY